ECDLQARKTTGCPLRRLRSSAPLKQPRPGFGDTTGIALRRLRSSAPLKLDYWEVSKTLIPASPTTPLVGPVEARGHRRLRTAPGSSPTTPLVGPVEASSRVEPRAAPIRTLRRLRSSAPLKRCGGLLRFAARPVLSDDSARRPR